MEENDFKRIEQLVSSVVDAKLGQHRKEVNEDFRCHVASYIKAEESEHGETGNSGHPEGQAAHF